MVVQYWSKEDQMTRERMREIAWKYCSFRILQEDKKEMPPARQIGQLMEDLNITDYSAIEKAFRALLDEKPLSAMNRADKISNGEVALRYTIFRISNGSEGRKINELARRNIGNLSRVIGEPIEDCLEFTRTILNDLIKQHLS
jgi:hypothetical protein